MDDKYIFTVTKIANVTIEQLDHKPIITTYFGDILPFFAQKPQETLTLRKRTWH